MGAMAVAIGYALKAQPLRCFPLCQWVLRPISWAERRLQAPFPSIPSPFYPPPWPLAASFPHLPSLFHRFPSSLSPLPVFRTCNVGNKNGLPRTFSSGHVTSGNCQHAFQASLWHFSVFRTCNVGNKIGLSCTFSSGRVTLGNTQPTLHSPLYHFTILPHISSLIHL